MIILKSYGVSIRYYKYAKIIFKDGEVIVVVYVLLEKSNVIHYHIIVIKYFKKSESNLMSTHPSFADRKLYLSSY